MSISWLPRTEVSDRLGGAYPLTYQPGQKSLRGHIRNLLKPEADRVPQDIEHPLTAETLLTYSLSMIDVRTKLLEPTVETDPTKQVVLKAIRDGLDRFQEKFAVPYRGWREDAWNEVYRLERLTVLIEPAGNLIDEIKRRLDEADAEKVPSAARLRRAFETVSPDAVDTRKSPPELKPGGEALLRSHLLDVLEEIQWFLRKKYTARRKQSKAASRILRFAVVSLMLFLLPYMMAFWFSYSEQHEFIRKWSGICVFTAMTAGMFGACFSRLHYLQSKWDTLSLDELNSAGEWIQIGLRVFVGMMGAILMLFFLHSDIVSSTLTPDFSKIGLIHHKAGGGENAIPLELVFPNPQLALLIVWSFIAGFSERLVPSFLAKTEASLDRESAKSK